MMRILIPLFLSVSCWADELGPDDVPHGSSTAAFVGSQSSALIQQLAQSTATMIDDDGLFCPRVGEACRMEKKPSTKEYCNQPFPGLGDDRNYPILPGAHCSSVLVSPIHVLMSGHCGKECTDKTAHFVFGLTREALQTTPLVSKKNIYNCKHFVKQENDDKTGMDFALVELDRPVENRTPITKVRRSNTPPENGTQLLAIGSPLQMPLTSLKSGVINTNQVSPGVQELQGYFDTYPGNSGGPVWSVKGDEATLEGIVAHVADARMESDDSGCIRLNTQKYNMRTNVQRLSNFWSSIEPIVNAANQKVAAPSSNTKTTGP